MCSLLTDNENCVVKVWKISLKLSHSDSESGLEGCVCLVYDKLWFGDMQPDKQKKFS